MRNNNKTPSKRKSEITAGGQNATNNNTQSHDTDQVSNRRSDGKRLSQEDNKDRSPLNKGYWNGLGEPIRLNAKKEEMGRSEEVKITFAKDIEKPPEIGESKDSDAIDTRSESIAVWTGTVGLITMRIEGA